MSSGRYCVIRDLGLVKGGKGMKHHDVLLTLTLKGLRVFGLGLARGLAAHFTASGFSRSAGSQRIH
jgi:hypothetical protein